MLNLKVDYKTQIVIYILRKTTFFDKNMLCIHLKNTDPFFCLAAEEYLLKNFPDDIFIIKIILPESF